MKEVDFYNVVRWLGNCPQCHIQNGIIWKSESMKSSDFRLPHCVACETEFNTLDSTVQTQGSELFPIEINKVIIENEYRAFFLSHPSASQITHADLLSSFLTCSMAEKFAFPEERTLLESSAEGGVHVLYSGRPVTLRNQRSYGNGGIGFSVHNPRPSKGEAVFAVMGYFEKLLTSLVINPIEYYERRYQSGAFLRLEEGSYTENAMQILKDGLTSLESKEFTNRVFKRLVIASSNQSRWRELRGI